VAQKLSNTTLPLYLDNVTGEPFEPGNVKSGASDAPVEKLVNVTANTIPAIIVCSDLIDFSILQLSRAVCALGRFQAQRAKISTISPVWMPLQSGRGLPDNVRSFQEFGAALQRHEGRAIGHSSSACPCALPPLGGQMIENTPWRVF